MKLIKKTENDVLYLYSPELEDAGFKNLFSTKIGGVSFQKNIMNFGTSCNDTEESIQKNYMKIFDILGSSPDKAVKAKQTHSDIVLSVDESFGGEGITKPQSFFEADGLITDKNNMTLLVFYADCVPILLADPTTKAIGAVHSGWRGTKAEIVRKAIEKMKSLHKCNPKNIMAAIGPAIGKCHFEVSEDIFNEFKGSVSKAFTEEKNGKFYVDLPNSVKNQLLLSGVPEENIAVSDLCTYCNDFLYSYRREGSSAGRMAAFIKNS